MVEKVELPELSVKDILQLKLRELEEKLVVFTELGNKERIRQIEKDIDFHNGLLKELLSHERRLHGYITNKTSRHNQRQSTR